MDVLREAKENASSGEADALTAVIAAAHAEAHESVDYEDEDRGGSGVMNEKKRGREWKALLQKSVLEHGVGRWEEKVIRGVFEEYLASSTLWCFLNILSWVMVLHYRGKRYVASSPAKSISNIYLSNLPCPSTGFSWI